MSVNRGPLSIVGPGLLVAATGVGAGDLATGALAGSRVGLAVLWAVVVGALLKYVLNEGLARYQLVTGSTLIEGMVGRLPFAGIIFLVYLLVWSFLVSLALMGACGVATHALVPVFEDASTAKIVFGAALGAVGVVLVLVGGFKLFERAMSICIAFMFVTVVATAALLGPDLGAVARGVVWPSPDTLRGDALHWTVALMGGVGGTVTVLCYGYWMREEGRSDASHIGLSRIDLAVAYVGTAIFGLAMVSIGSTIVAGGRGAGLVVDLAARLEEPLGTTGKYVFLIGAWGAMFSSLLGVWQSVPYLFADLIRCLRDARASRRGGARAAAVSTRSTTYRVGLVALAAIPALFLYKPFSEVQKLYAVFGAAFMPLLALALLFLNGRWGGVPARHRNRPWTVAILAATLVFFGWIFVRAW